MSEILFAWQVWDSVIPDQRGAASTALFEHGGGSTREQARAVREDTLHYVEHVHAQAAHQREQVFEWWEAFRSLWWCCAKPEVIEPERPCNRFRSFQPAFQPFCWIASDAGSNATPKPRCKFTSCNPASVQRASFFGPI